MIKNQNKIKKQNKCPLNMNNNLTLQSDSKALKWCPHGVVGNVLDSNFIEKKSEIQSRYDIHFRTNAIGKDEVPIPFSFGGRKYLDYSSVRMVLALDKPQRLICH